MTETVTTRPPLRRASQDRVVAGVARGIAEHLGVRVRNVRILLLVFAALNGAGVVAYAYLWATVPLSGAAEGEVAKRRPVWAWLFAAGVALVAVGTVTAAPVGPFSQVPSWAAPLALVAVGVFVVWSMLDEDRRGPLGAGPRRRRALAGVAIGLVLCALGAMLVVGRGRSLSELRDIALATLVVLFGVVLIVAPWGVRAWEELRAEQAARARATERADIAAHLHDSVLQTLALIQRKSADPAAVARLARAQEKELRAYLYGAARAQATTLRAACQEMVDEVEDLHAVPIELVVSGDRPLDDDGAALVQAMREALRNAVRHGAPPVTAFVDVGRTEVEAFVRDHGPGFDPEDIPADRLGVRGSVIGRMERHGGHATVRWRSPGTEVELVLPVRQPAADAGAPGARAGGSDAVPGTPAPPEGHPAGPVPPPPAPAGTIGTERPTTEGDLP